MSSTKKPVIVGYWAIRCYVEPIILILEYKQVPYHFESYLKEQEEDGSWFGGRWFKEAKHNLGLDFPNLPYYIEEDGFKLTESLAILRHLGRMHDLYGDGSVRDASAIDMLVDRTVELREMFVNLTYGKEFEKERFLYPVKAREKFGYFERYLQKSDWHWLRGDKISICDFLFWSVMDQHECLYSDIFDNLPRVKELKKRMEYIPAVADFLKSDRFNKFPITSPNATWGGRKNELNWNSEVR